jgi:hypothetical protein
MTRVGPQRHGKKKTWKSERLCNEIGLYTGCSRIRFADITLITGKHFFIYNQ